MTLVDMVLWSFTTSSFTASKIDGEYGPDPRVLCAVADLGDRFRWHLGDEPTELLQVQLQVQLYDDDPELGRAAG